MGAAQNKYHAKRFQAINKRFLKNYDEFKNNDEPRECRQAERNNVSKFKEK